MRFLFACGASAGHINPALAVAGRLRELLPDCEIRWEYEFQGVRYPSDTTELKVTDLTGLEDALRYLKKHCK